MLRPLNEIEYLNWTIGQPYNVVGLADVEGTIPPELLVRALARLQERHPLLRVNVDLGADDRPRFFDEGVGPIPLEVIEQGTETAALDVFGREMLRAFERGPGVTGPLARVSVVASAGRTSLVVTMQHVVSDGFSMVFFLRDLLALVASPDRDLPRLGATAEDVDWLKPEIRKRIPKTDRRFRAARAATRVALLFKRTQARMYAPRAEDFRTLSWRMSSEETGLLVAEAKRQGVTVHSAICAAMIPFFDVINSPVNLRRRLRIDPGEAVGLFASGAVVRLRCGPREPLWDVARRYQRRLRSATSDSKLFGLFRLFSKAVSPQQMRAFGEEFLRLRAAAIPLGITNLGSLDSIDLVPPGAPFKVIDFKGAISSPLPVVTLLVYTLGGAMRFYLYYYETDLATAEAQRLTQSFRRALERGAQPGAGH